MNEVKDLTKSKQSEIPETDSKRNEIITFNNSEFGKVRTTMIDGLPWFVLKDVCAAFGDQHYRRVASRLDDDEKGVTHIDTPGGVQEMIIVNESGIYSALFAMQPEKAPGVTDEYIEDRIAKLKKFTRWVTHDVLPSIRKTGKYALSDHIREELETRRAEALARLEEARVAELAARTENSRVYLRCLDFLPRKFHEQHETLLGLAANTAAGRRVISFDCIPDLNIDCATHDEDCPVSLQYDDSPIPYFL